MIGTNCFERSEFFDVPVQANDHAALKLSATRCGHGRPPTNLKPDQGGKAFEKLKGPENTLLLA
jgi:hypothetical protein